MQFQLSDSLGAQLLKSWQSKNGSNGTKSEQIEQSIRYMIKRVSLAQLETTVDFSGEGTEFNPCCQQGIFSKVANSGADRGELPPRPAS